MKALKNGYQKEKKIRISLQFLIVKTNSIKKAENEKKKSDDY